MDELESQFEELKRENGLSKAADPLDSIRHMGPGELSQFSCGLYQTLLSAISIEEAYSDSEDDEGASPAQGNSQQSEAHHPLHLDHRHDSTSFQQDASSVSLGPLTPTSIGLHKNDTSVSLISGLDTFQPINAVINLNLQEASSDDSSDEEGGAGMSRRGGSAGGISSAAASPLKLSRSVRSQMSVDGYEMINDYQIIDEIGKGQCGRVLLAIKEGEDTPKAIKVVPREKLAKKLNAMSPKASPVGTPTGGNSPRSKRKQHFAEMRQKSSENQQQTENGEEQQPAIVGVGKIPPEGLSDRPFQTPPSQEHTARTSNHLYGSFSEDPSTYRTTGDAASQPSVTTPSQIGSALLLGKGTPPAGPAHATSQDDEQGVKSDEAEVRKVEVDSSSDDGEDDVDACILHSIPEELLEEAGLGTSGVSEDKTPTSCEKDVKVGGSSCTIAMATTGGDKANSESIGSASGSMHFGTAPPVPAPLDDILLSDGSEVDLEILQREVAVMKRVSRHKNIVTLYEVIDDEQEGFIYLVMQYCSEGPIFNVKNDGSCDRLESEKVKKYMQQILKALSFLDRNGILHLDIKPDNILKDAEDCVYLADFGMSEMLDQEQLLSQSNMGMSISTTGATPSQRSLTGGRGGFTPRPQTTQKGTPAFMSPEMCRGEENITSATDIWSLGVTLYCMLLGELPFKGGWRETTRQIMNDDPKIPADDLDPNWQVILLGMLQKNPQERVSLQWLRAHPFLSSGKRNKELLSPNVHGGLNGSFNLGLSLSSQRGDGSLIGGTFDAMCPTPRDINMEPLSNPELESALSQVNYQRKGRFLGGIGNSTTSFGGGSSGVSNSFSASYGRVLSPVRPSSAYQSLTSPHRPPPSPGFSHPNSSFSSSTAGAGSAPLHSASNPFLLSPVTPTQRQLSQQLVSRNLKLLPPMPISPNARPRDYSTPRSPAGGICLGSPANGEGSFSGSLEILPPSAVALTPPNPLTTSPSSSLVNVRGLPVSSKRTVSDPSNSLQDTNTLTPPPPTSIVHPNPSMGRKSQSMMVHQISTRPNHQSSTSTLPTTRSTSGGVLVEIQTAEPSSVSESGSPVYVSPGGRISRKAPATAWGSSASMSRSEGGLTGSCSLQDSSSSSAVRLNPPAPSVLTQENSTSGAFAPSNKQFTSEGENFGDALTPPPPPPPGPQPQRRSAELPEALEISTAEDGSSIVG